ncbi:MAG: hypothetical protein IJC74_06105 [Clostridia bacterium]|nr:hypothetical protein [Clostridia bacterium]
MDKFAIQALNEYCSDTKTVRRGGVNGKPFWNVNASQFMFAPDFLFPLIPGTKEYVFTAVDSNGKKHSFKADVPTAPLTPIWRNIAPGMVELKVEAVHEKSGVTYLAGARTFFKMMPFPGRESLPRKACSYKECSVKAFRYVFYDATTQYWLTHGVPKPDYYHNVYPSKTISSIINAMVSYAELEPENAEKALKIASNAADYLISITYGEDSALAGLPPTYSFKGLIKEIVDETAPAADGRKDMLMTIYPAMVGSSYLKLEKATKDEKYFKAAQKIAEYYRKNVLENGSWYLLVSEKTGKSDSPNCCGHFAILDFLNEFYLITGEECWHNLERNYFEYIKKTRLDTYNWEGQFEDIPLTAGYTNLTHLSADGMINYIVNNMADDSEMIKEAEELIHFVEDQFVVWGDFAPWNPHYGPEEYWYSPAALEQYNWHVPIDGSTAAVIKAFLDMYSLTGDDLFLEKACALGDSVTRMQNPETGVIPTHWMTKDCSTVLKNFWINCHIGTAFNMMILAKAIGEI